jgi:DUF1707 SHOCT-like domain
LAKVNPDGSFPITEEGLRAARKILPLKDYTELLRVSMEHMEKDKNRHIILSSSVGREFPIPPNMDVEHYQGMKLVPGHRVGWEYKQTYIGKLAELFAEGYLSEEEYDKRVAWVNDSQTSEQIDVVFTDLQNALMQMKVKEYLPAVNSESKLSKAWLTLPLFLYSVIILGMVTDAVTGFWSGTCILMVAFIFCIYQAAKMYKKMK